MSRKWQAIAIWTGQQELGPIEAKNLKEATDLAWDMAGGIMQLCPECSDKIDGLELTEMDMQEEK